MKTIKKVFAIAGLLALSIPGVALAGNTTNEQNKNTISGQVAVTASTQTAGLLAGRISQAVSGAIGNIGSGGFSGGGSGGFGGGAGGVAPSSGKSSGNGAEGYGVWAMGTGSYMESSKSGGKYDGSLFSAIVGVDKQFGDLLVGVGMGYEKLDITTKYNSGNMLYDGWSVIPYMAYAINKGLIADASFSYTWLDYTMKDTQGATKYSDNMDANRMVTSIGLTQLYNWDKFLFSGRLGTMYLHEHQGSYKLNATDYGQSGIYTWQGSLGLRAAYDMGAFKPFAGLTYMQDFVKSGGTHNDMWGSDFDLGATYNVTDTLQFGLTGTYGVRENFQKIGGLLNVRYEF